MAKIRFPREKIRLTLLSEVEVQLQLLKLISGLYAPVLKKAVAQIKISPASCGR